MWMSPKQIAEAYGISLRTVTNIAREMEEQGYRLFRSRIVRIEEHDLDEYMRRRNR